MSPLNPSSTSTLSKPSSRAAVLQYHRDQFILAREAIKQGRKLEGEQEGKAQVVVGIGTRQINKMCFTSSDQLKNAVQMYLGGRWTKFLDAAFYGAIEDWCFTDGVTHMAYLFSRLSWGSAVADFNQDIGKWDVSKVTSMFGMFRGATAFNQDIGKWDVSKVTSMHDMFRDAEAFNQNIGKWDVSQVNDMTRMFSYATAFNQEIGSWKVSQVTRMDNMFARARAFNQDIGKWDVSQPLTRILEVGMSLGFSIWVTHSQFATSKTNSNKPTTPESGELFFESPLELIDTNVPWASYAETSKLKFSQESSLKLSDLKKELTERSVDKGAIEINITVDKLCGSGIVNEFTGAGKD
eukprot:scaffold4876_cov176-Skeletonema_dohrnii-CCMP3373.AAC.1